MRPLEPSEKSTENGLFQIKQMLEADREESRLDQIWSQRLTMLFGVLIAFYVAFLLFYVSLRG